MKENGSSLVRISQEIWVKFDFEKKSFHNFEYNFEFKVKKAN